MNKAKRKSRITKKLLRETIHEHLVEIGFTQNCRGYCIAGDVSKQKIRDLHAQQRRQNLAENLNFIQTHGSELAKSFASGHSLVSNAIDPELVEVSAGSAESRLFRFACLLWSVPVSQGFGRRLRFLLRDRSNGCLIGLFALGDPVFNLSARDNWIGWNHEDRCHRLTHVMDAYVVGAVPPYSMLLGGKLVASMMCSAEVKQAYERKYLGLTGVISKKENRSRLVLLTTTSALGRSSIYNRLAIPDSIKFLRIGTTKGFGHFQLSNEIYELLRQYLETQGHPYASGHRFGMGPNWKIRVVRVGLESLGLEPNGILKHGIEREVYAIPLARNWREILSGDHKNVRSLVRPASDISGYCLDRWVIPRGERDKRYKRFARRRVMDCLLNGGPAATW